MGEIDAANPVSLTDDLSNFKPSENAGHSHSRNEDRGNRSNDRRGVRKPRENNRQPRQEMTVEKIVHLRTINLQKAVNLTSLTIVKAINREENREAQEITIIHPNRDLKIPSIPKTGQVDQESHIPRHLPKLR